MLHDPHVDDVVAIRLIFAYTIHRTHYLVGRPVCKAGIAVEVAVQLVNRDLQDIGRAIGGQLVIAQHQRHSLDGRVHPQLARPETLLLNLRCKQLSHQ